MPGLQIPDCDILINATNSGLYPDSGCPDICYENIKEGMIVQDIITNPAETINSKKAKEKGALTFDGLSMLVYQGAWPLRCGLGSCHRQRRCTKRWNRYLNHDKRDEGGL